ncbi:hypothetical protein ACIGD1_11410 [Streptomyces sp. NPDC085612]|uniref:hypothetical protein n=1 Tax=Streptomyces sp. NPDC085612 TaxID=3365732 RepID=UPI0037D5D143
MTNTTRVRLHGGRAVHAAKAIDHGHITNCAIYLSTDSTNHWLPDNTAITCRRCVRDKDASRTR